MQITIDIKEEKTENGKTRFITTFSPEELPSLCLALISGEPMKEVALNAAALIASQEPGTLERIKAMAEQLTAELER